MKRKRTRKIPEPVSGGGSRNHFDHLRAINRIVTDSTQVNPITALSEIATYRDLNSIGPNDVAIAKAVVNMTNRVKKDTYIDYAHFLLQPDAYPKKVRVPGMLQNPVGTEIRNFRNFKQIRVSGTSGDVTFVWSPACYTFGKATRSPATVVIPSGGGAPTFTQTPGTAFGVNCFKAYWDAGGVDAQGRPVANPTYAKVGYDLSQATGLQDYFVSGRLLAAQLTINVIMNKMGSGRIVSSPVYSTDPPKDQIWAQPPSNTVLIPDNATHYQGMYEPVNSTVEGVDIGTIMDNKIIYDSNIESGLQMVYIPVDNPNYDFMDCKTGVFSWEQGHKNRMDYIGIIRGLPDQARIEIYLSGYFEFNVKDTMFELFASPFDISNYTHGSTQELNDAINNLRQDPVNFMGAPGERGDAYIQDERVRYDKKSQWGDVVEKGKRVGLNALSYAFDVANERFGNKNITPDDIMYIINEKQGAIEDGPPRKVSFFIDYFNYIEDQILSHYYEGSPFVWAVDVPVRHGRGGASTISGGGGSIYNTNNDVILSKQNKQINVKTSSSKNDKPSTNKNNDTPSRRSSTRTKTGSSKSQIDNTKAKTDNTKAKTDDIKIKPIKNIIKENVIDDQIIQDLSVIKDQAIRQELINYYEPKPSEVTDNSQKLIYTPSYDIVKDAIGFIEDGIKDKGLNVHHRFREFSEQKVPEVKEEVITTILKDFGGSDPNSLSEEFINAKLYNAILDEWTVMNIKEEYAINMTGFWKPKHSYTKAEAETLQNILTEARNAVKTMDVPISLNRSKKRDPIFSLNTTTYMEIEDAYTPNNTINDEIEQEEEPTVESIITDNKMELEEESILEPNPSHTRERIHDYGQEIMDDIAKEREKEKLDWTEELKKPEAKEWLEKFFDKEEADYRIFVLNELVDDAFHVNDLLEEGYMIHPISTYNKLVKRDPKQIEKAITIIERSDMNPNLRDPVVEDLIALKEQLPEEIYISLIDNLKKHTKIEPIAFTRDEADRDLNRLEQLRTFMSKVKGPIGQAVKKAQDKYDSFLKHSIKFNDMLRKFRNIKRGDVAKYWGKIDKYSTRYLGFSILEMHEFIKRKKYEAKNFTKKRNEQFLDRMSEKFDELEFYSGLGAQLVFNAKLNLVSPAGMMFGFNTLSLQRLGKRYLDTGVVEFRDVQDTIVTTGIITLVAAMIREFAFSYRLWKFSPLRRVPEMLPILKPVLSLYVDLEPFMRFYLPDNFARAVHSFNPDLASGILAVRAPEPIEAVNDYISRFYIPWVARQAGANPNWIIESLDDIGEVFGHLHTNYRLTKDEWIYLLKETVINTNNQLSNNLYYNALKRKVYSVIGNTEKEEMVLPNKFNVLFGIDLPGIRPEGIYNKNMYDWALDNVPYPLSQWTD